MREADFQAKVIKWLKSKGCIVIKMQQNATTHSGIADLFFCFEGFYGFLEVKKSRNAKFQPLQKRFIEKINKWSYGAVVYPENFEKIKKELSEMLR